MEDGSEVKLLIFQLTNQVQEARIGGLGRGQNRGLASVSVLYSPDVFEECPLLACATVNPLRQCHCERELVCDAVWGQPIPVILTNYFISS